MSFVSSLVSLVLFKSKMGFTVFLQRPGFSYLRYAAQVEYLRGESKYAESLGCQAPKMHRKKYYHHISLSIYIRIFYLCHMSYKLYVGCFS